MNIIPYMATDDVFAYYFPGYEDIYVNIANCYRKGYKKFAERINEVILQEIICKAGNIINHTLQPLMVEFRLRDLMQIIVGATVLAIPLAFTEETWRLGETLPVVNVFALSLLSLFFIALFVYYNFYRYNLKNNFLEYIKRIFSIYVISIIVVGIILSIIQKCPWGIDNILALKRILIVAFPASMSAAITDVLK